MKMDNKKFVFSLITVPGELPIVHIVIPRECFDKLVAKPAEGDTMDLTRVGVPLKLILSARETHEEAVAYVHDLAKGAGVDVVVDAASMDFGLKTPKPKLSS